MIKLIEEEKTVTELKSASPVIIYGAGWHGRIVADYFSLIGIDIYCFAVSDERYLKECSIEGFSIKTINDCYRSKPEAIIVVGTTEKDHEEMIKNAQDAGYKKLFPISNEFYRFIQGQIREDRLNPRDTLNFEVHLCDHCDLKCKGCYHFSPLSKETFLDIREYENDIRRLDELWQGKITKVSLLGGEPFLHPDLNEFILLSRKVFPAAVIDILTNGLILSGKDDSFWRLCADNNICIACTKYPVNIDYTYISNKAEEYGIHFEFHNDTVAGEKKLIKYPFDITGSQNIEDNYRKCHRSNTCITLKHGRLYTCPIAAHAHIAKEFFELDIELDEKDYIDIYKANSSDEIARFLSQPIPFCRYCDLSVAPRQFVWEPSKKEYDEWF